MPSIARKHSSEEKWGGKEKKNQLWWNIVNLCEPNNENETIEQTERQKRCSWSQMWGKRKVLNRLTIQAELHVEDEGGLLEYETVKANM